MSRLSLSKSFLPGLMLLAGFLVYQPSAYGSFAAGWDNSSGTVSYAPQFGDLDGDGDMDIAQPTTLGSPVRVYINNGSGTYSAGWTSTETDDNFNLVLGDVDGDGDLDFVTAGNNGAPSRVYKNNGAATFSLHFSTVETNNSWGIDLGDYDNDGDLDLLVGHQSNSPSDVYKNDGSGTFTKVFSTPNGEAREAMWADLNGDGVLEFILSNTSQAKKIYAYAGNDSFTNVWTSSEADATIPMDVADFDNDGDLDLIFSKYNLANAQVYRNDGNFSFTLVHTPAETAITWALKVADYDGDGDMDYVAGNNNLGTIPVRVYRNDGTFSFTNILNITTDYTSGLNWADVDGDGDMDLATSAQGSPALKIWTNTLNPSNNPPTMGSLITEPDGVSGSIKLQWSAGTDDNTPIAGLTYNLRVGTFPGGNDVMSGKLPAGPGNVGQALSHSLNLSAGAGTVTYYWSVQAVDNTGWLTSSFAAEDSFVVSDFFSSTWNNGQTYELAGIGLGDYDNDGDLDIGFAGHNNQNSRLYRNDGGNTYTQVWTSPATYSAYSWDWGDYDRDGDMDILLGILNGPNRVFRNDGGDTFTLVWSSPESGATHMARWADVDKDGDLDQIVSDDNQAKRVYRNDGSNTWTLIWSSGDANNTYDMDIGDIDGDGDIDIIVANSSGQQNRIYTNNGDGQYTLAWTSPESDTSVDVGLADFDGDGDLDFVVVNNGANRVYRNNGDGTYTSMWTSVEAGNSHSVDVGDIDGDGDMDFILGGYGNQNRAYLNNGSFSFSMAYSTAATYQHGDIKLGDLDNDGDLDYVSGNHVQNAFVATNQLNPTSTPPSAPTLTTEPDGYSGSVKLIWSAGTDAQTPTALLTYNLKIGTYSGGNDVFSAVIPSGPGNVGQALSHTIILSAGGATRTYFWSVQTIDNTGFLASAFATEDSFNISDIFATAYTSGETENSWTGAAGDVDGDGDLDQVVVNYNQANRVYRNDGSNTFTSVWTSTETDASRGLSLGDYDNDGDLDQLVGNYAQQNRVYRNDGGNSFTLVWSSTESDNTISIAWGDYDNDGDLDQLAGNQNQANRVYRNDGSNTFTLVWSSTETENTYGVTWGDADGDGDLDQLVANYGQVNRIYRNDGGGTFTAAWASPQTDDTISATFGDYDADGDLDQLVGNGTQPNRVYRKDSGLAYTLVWSSALTEQTHSGVWGDYDQDGDLDVLIGNYAQANRVYRNDGGNAFTSVWTSLHSENTEITIWADMDGDGDLDQFSPNYAHANRIYRNNNTVTNTAPTAPTLTSEADAYSGSIKLEWSAATDTHTPANNLTYNLRVGTFSGGNDVFSSIIPAGPGNVGQSLSWSLLLSGSTGTQTYFWSVQAIDASGFLSGSFSTEDSFVITEPFLSVWTTPEADTSRTVDWGDMDGDGDLDQLVANNGVERVYRNDGSDTFTLVWSGVTSDNSYSALWGDYDRDGDLDFVVANNGGQVDRVYKNNGGASFTEVWSTPQTDNGLFANWADLDNDGDLDFAVANQGQVNRVYRNDGADTFSLAWSSTETDNSYKTYFADSDGDGDMDMFVPNGGAEANRVYRNNGNFSFTLVWSSPQTEDTRGMALGDLDGDGDVDQYTTGYTGVPDRVYRNDGNNTFTLAWSSSETEAGLGADIGDIDGDGDNDVAIAAENASNRVYRNDGGLTFSSIWISPAPTTIAVTSALGDHDGDGDLDFAISNTAAVVNRLYKNNLNPTNTAPATPGLTPEPDGYSGSIKLVWGGSSDTQTTNADLLSYNLRVGTFSGGNDVFSSKIPAGPGNVGQALSWSLTLSGGASGVQTYYWSVQAVDNTGYLSSAFSTEDSFVITEPFVEAFNSNTAVAISESAGVVEFGDVDGDGDMDILSTANPPRVWRNTGVFSFTSIYQPAESGCPHEGDFGDVDNDGDLDFVISFCSGSNHVYRNDGSGSFTLSWSTPQSEDTRGAALKDFDNDGDLDLWSANHNQTSRVYANDGTGQFTLAWTAGASGPGYEVAACDFDGDGDLDVHESRYGTANVVYRNDGAMSFTSVWTSVETENTTNSACADMDGDGDADIVVGAPLRIYRNDGGFSFSSQYTGGSLGVSFGSLFDADGDGDVDMLLSDGANSRLELFQNNGGLSFTSLWQSPSNISNPSEMGITDIDGDGDGDVGVSNNGNGPLRVLKNQLSAANTAPSTPTLTAEPDGYSGSIKLQWSATTDDHTSGALLTYTLRVGKTPGGNEIFSSKIPSGPGNVGNALSWSLTLSGGPTGMSTYYWSVQAVDNTGFLTSSFATEDSFVVNEPFYKAFDSQVSFGITNSGVGGHFGDVDGDGDLDLVNALNSAQANRVWRNDGNYSFVSSYTTPETGNNHEGQFGDIDNDGDLDLVIGGFTNQTNRAYLNNGAGSFTLAWTSSFSEDTRGLILRDLDNDGDLDIWASNFNQNSRVYANNGLGQFTSVWTTPSSGNNYNSMACDFDNDGDLDVYEPRSAAQADLVWRNNGDLTFTNIWTSPETEDTWGGACGDLDGDGDADLIASNASAQPTRVYRNDGNFTFSSQYTTSNKSTFDVRIVDIDGDGDNDFILTNTGNGYFEVHLNNGGFSFLESYSVNYGSAAIREAILGDLDGDGDSDLGITGDPASMNLYRNGISAVNTAPTAPTLSAEPDGISGSIKLEWSAATDDHTSANLLNYTLRVGTSPGDNNVFSSKIPSGPGNVGQALSWSLTLSGGASGNQTYYWSVQAVDNTGFLTSSFATEDSFVVVEPFGAVWNSAETELTRTVIWGDYDGDGDLDQLVGNANQVNRVYRNDGGNVFTAIWVSTETEATMAAAWGDYDGDGDLDQLVGNDGQANRVYRNDGGNVFTAVWASTETESTWGIAWGDYDNDGDLDQLVGNNNQANRVYRNDGGNVFTSVWTSPQTEASFSVVWGDSDGDGDLDQLVGNYGQPNRVYRNDGGNVFTAVWASPQSENTHSIAWGDYDGDGDLDQLAGNEASQTNRVYRNDGGNVFTAVWNSAETESTTSVAWGDYDGDGDLDQLIGNLNQVNRVYRNDGGNVFTPVWSSIETETTISAVWGDYDGDGDLDQLVGNSTQTNRVYRNNNIVNNTAPTAPTLTAEPDANPGTIKLEWSAGSDTQTSAALLTYNLRVGTTIGGKEILSSIIPSGPGNVGQALSWSLTLSGGASGNLTYYWSVQTVDNTGYLSSSFAAEDSFQIFEPLTQVFNQGDTDDNYSVKWGDMNQDNLPDYASFGKVYTNSGGSSFSEAYNDGAVTFVVGTDLGDVDGDGILDMLTVLCCGQTTRISKNSGSSFSAYGTVSGGSNYGGTLFDFENDGDLDVALGDFDNGGQARIFRNTGGSFTLAFTMAAADLRTLGIGKGDLNNDGLMDLVIPSTNTSVESYLLIQQAGGSFTEVPIGLASDFHSSVAVADVTGDGKQDIVFGSNSTPLRVYRNDGGNAFSLVWSTGGLESTLNVALGDMDGDGDADLVTAQGLYLNDGTGQFTKTWNNPFAGSGIRGIDLADMDGDNDLDVVMTCQVCNNRVFRNNYNPTNNAPSVPALTAEADGLSGSIKLEWAISSDDHTPAPAISYNLRVGTSPGGHQVFSGIMPPGPGNMGTALSYTINLSAGATAVTYYWSVQAVDNTGFLTSSFAAEDSFVLDATGPSTPVPVDDGQYSNSTTQLSFSWPAATETNTAVASYLLSIGTSPGASNTYASQSVGLTTSALITGLTLTNGQIYYGSVAAINAVGLTSSVGTTDGITVDTTAPSTVSSLLDAGAQQSSTTTLSFSWSAATDGESGINRYVISVGTTPGASNTVASQSVGLSTSANLTGLTLVSGTTYYASVAAVNGGNFTGSVLTTDGILVDNGLPGVAGLVDQGQYQTSTTMLSFSWTAATSPSGIADYILSIGTTPGATNTVASQSMGITTSVNLTGLTLTGGQIYYASVAAVTSAGLTGSASTTDGITVDTSAPPAVIALADSGTYQSNLSTLTASWTAPTDAESGITGYLYSLGTTPGGNDTIASTSVGITNSIILTGLSLTGGQAYYFSVAAINGAGLTGSVSTTNGITPDTSAPTAVTALADSGATQGSLTTFNVTWTAATDTESGVTGYVYSLGTTPGGNNTIASTSVGVVTSLNLTGLTLTGGQTYYLSVAAINGAGLTGSVSTTDGILVDAATAVVSNLVDSGLYQTSATTFSASWTAATPPPTGIAGYFINLGTTSGGSQVILSQSVGLNTSVNLTGLNLTSGQAYFLSVIAVNGAGVTGSAVTTDGITVDTSAPTAPTALGDSGQFQTTTATFNATWAAATDPQSTITGYIYSLGTTPGGNNTIASTSVGVVTSLNLTGLSLVSGQAYYLTLAAINGAGLTSSFVITDGLTIDTSAPAFTTLTDAGQFQSATTTLSVSWTAATDAESNINGYQISLGTTPGGSNTVASQSLGLVTTHQFTDLNLTVGTTYYAAVTAINGAGLSTSLVTDGIAIFPTGAVTGLTDAGAYTNIATTYSASWTLLTTPVANYIGSLHELPAGTAVVASQSLGLVNQVNMTNLNLTTDRNFVYCVKAVFADSTQGPVVCTDGLVVDTTAPACAFSSPAQNGQVNGQTTISGTASDAFFLSASLGIGPGATPSSFANLASLTTGVTNGTLGQWNSTGRTGPYLLQLQVDDRAGNRSTCTRPIAATSSGLSIETAIPKHQWSIVSLPVVPTDATPATLITGGNFSLLAYDPDKTPDVLGRYKPPATLSQGQGYMVYTPADGVSLKASGQPVTTAAPFEKALATGWHLISTPYNHTFPIQGIRVKDALGLTKSFAEAITSGWVQSRLFELQAGTTNGFSALLDNQTINPRTGYFWRVNQPVTVLFDPAQAGLGPVREASSEPFGLNLKLTLKSGSQVDEGDTLALMAGPVNSWKVGEPPSVPDGGISLSIVEGEDRFSVLPRQAGPGQHRWTVMAKTQSGGRLTWRVADSLGCPLTVNLLGGQPQPVVGEGGLDLPAGEQTMIFIANCAGTGTGLQTVTTNLTGAVAGVYLAGNLTAEEAAKFDGAFRMGVDGQYLPIDLTRDITQPMAVLLVLKGTSTSLQTQVQQNNSVEVPIQPGWNLVPNILSNPLLYTTAKVSFRPTGKTEIPLAEAREFVDDIPWLVGDGGEPVEVSNPVTHPFAPGAAFIVHATAAGVLILKN